MQKTDELYAGKAKTVYSTDDPDKLILLFRNDTSAFDGEKIEQLDRKGMVNNLFTAFSNSFLNNSALKLTFSSTVFVYSNIALAIYKRF